jgi:hypothetical protein
MLRKTLRRCGVLALVLALALAAAAPVAADEIGGSRIGIWSSVWDWLADAFGFSAPGDTEGNTGGLRGLFEPEGAGFDPNGDPKPTETPDEGAGFDPNGNPNS